MRRPRPPKPLHHLRRQRLPLAQQQSRRQCRLRVRHRPLQTIRHPPPNLIHHRPPSRPRRPRNPRLLREKRSRYPLRRQIRRIIKPAHRPRRQQLPRHRHHIPVPEIRSIPPPDQFRRRIGIHQPALPPKQIIAFSPARPQPVNPPLRNQQPETHLSRRVFRIVNNPPHHHHLPPIQHRRR